MEFFGRRMLINIFSDNSIKYFSGTCTFNTRTHSVSVKGSEKFVEKVQVKDRNSHLSRKSQMQMYKNSYKSRENDPREDEKKG